MQKSRHVFVRVWHFRMFLTRPWSSCFFPESEKIPLKHRGTIACRKYNTSQIPSDSPADNLLHKHAWCGADRLYSFNFPFYFPRACIHFSRQHVKVFLSHKSLLRDLSLDAGFETICGISCYLFSIAIGPSHTELARKQQVFCLSSRTNSYI